MTTPRRKKSARLRIERGPDLTTGSVTATLAKNHFGQLLDAAIHGRPVTITKNRRPRAVLLSVEEYTALSHAEQRALNTLSAQFDAMLTRLQTPKARAALHAAFAATPEALGQAAVAAARKRA
jgi:antitoxin Phd